MIYTNKITTNTVNTQQTYTHLKTKINTYVYDISFSHLRMKVSKFLQGMRYKMFGKDAKKGQSGVGIAVQEEWVGSVARVMTASERLMAVELILEGELVTFVSVDAPQVGRPQEE